MTSTVGKILVIVKLIFFPDVLPFMVNQFLPGKGCKSELANVENTHRKINERQSLICSFKAVFSQFMRYMVSVSCSVESLTV